MIYLIHNIKYDHSGNRSYARTQSSTYYGCYLFFRAIHCHGIAVVKIRILIALKLDILRLGIKLFVYASKEPVCFKGINYVLDIIRIYGGQSKYYTAYYDEPYDMIKAQILIQPIDYNPHKDAVKKHPFSMAYKPQKK